MRLHLVVLMALAGSAAFPLPAAGHHPLAELYDRDRTITFTGTLRAVEWANPHVVIVIDVMSGQEAQTWRVEMDAPNSMMRRRGLHIDQFTAGAPITVTGSPSHTGAPAAVARTLVLPGGQTVEVTDDSSWNWRRTN